MLAAVSRLHQTGTTITVFTSVLACTQTAYPTAMPRKAFHQEKEGVAKAKRARRLLTGKGIAREDSDDELGLEEHPWSWIYADDVVGSIVGASHGKFECKLGDCVLLKAEGTSQAWVGIICDFQEDEEGEKVANFMWFSTEKEIRNKDKKRTDSLPVGRQATAL